MFASKRCKLVKRLWEESSKLVASYLSSPAQPPLWAAAAGDYDAFCSSPEERKAVECLLKRLRDSQLETMLRAVQTRGRDGTACLPLPHGDVKLPREVVAPHVLCCRLWRWPQLRHQYELKRLPWCAASPLHVCCNPYHWSIVHKPDSPPPPYSPLPLEDTYPPIGSTAEASTATTGGRNGPPTEPEASAEPWCIIAYWELNERVGPLYRVQRPWLHVTFDERPSVSAGEEQQALSLHELAAKSACRDAVVLRTRAHIGQGVTLLQERDGVWAYNRSEKALFVASPTLDGPSVRNLTVFKVPPGYSLRVFDWERARLYRSYPPASCDGPSYPPYFARISFVKGWGPKYARQVVTSLPCSLELIFRAPPPR